MTEYQDVGLEQLAEAFSLPQAERLAYIDFCVRFLGSISRADIMGEFKVAQAAASRDLSLYRELKPGNSSIDTATKRTVIKTETYSPLLRIEIHTALNIIQYGFSRSELMQKRPMLSVEIVDPLYQPERLKENQVSIVSRAINDRTGILCTYGSKSGDHHRRLLFPSALFMDRKSWYFRAYDRNEEEPHRSGFKNFKLSRIFDVVQENNKHPSPAEVMDREWDEKVTFIIEFKKNLSKETIDEISREFSISGNVHSITCRAALALFVKTNWKIDLTNNDENNWLYFDVLNTEALKDVGSLSSQF